MPRRNQTLHLPVDPADSAAFAGLQYVTYTAPGYSRKRAGTGFRIVDPDGRTIRDREHLSRIQSLAIPPAWTSVWICPASDGHLQAIGYDARGRRQYRYHPHYREVRNQTKFERLPDFAAALPAIRSRVAADLSLPFPSTREGSCNGRTAPRNHQHANRQCRIRQRKRIVWVNHPAKSPRRY